MKESGYKRTKLSNKCNYEKVFHITHLYNAVKQDYGKNITKGHKTVKYLVICIIL